MLNPEPWPKLVSTVGTRVNAKTLFLNKSHKSVHHRGKIPGPKTEHGRIKIFDRKTEHMAGERASAFDRAKSVKRLETREGPELTFMPQPGPKL